MTRIPVAGLSAERPAAQPPLGEEAPPPSPELPALLDGPLQVPFELHVSPPGQFACG
jgi:hypothetical protein